MNDINTMEIILCMCWHTHFF